MLLAKKVALVTGASRGIGKGIALEMARAGADVIVNYNNSKEKANDVVRSVEALGRRSLALKADVSNQNEVEAMRKSILAEFDGGVDILVNNAGIHHHLKSWQIDQAEWKRILAVNLDGVFLCTNAFNRDTDSLLYDMCTSYAPLGLFHGFCENV